MPCTAALRSTPFSVKPVVSITTGPEGGGGGRGEGGGGDKWVREKQKAGGCGISELGGADYSACFTTYSICNMMFFHIDTENGFELNHYLFRYPKLSVYV